MNTDAFIAPVLTQHGEAMPDRPPICAPAWSREWLVQKIARAYSRVRHAAQSSKPVATGFKELDEVRNYARTWTDIDEHLERMFLEALSTRPKMIVELGVRGGASTFVFERVAELCHATLISADLEDCSSVSPNPRWHFFRGDDVQFADKFSEFCAARGIVPSIDLLFIDTSHYYEHTVQEIASWFPLLTPRAKVIFHDTNLKPIGPRSDGCYALGWDNQRGVIRAVEEYLGISVDETKQTAAWKAGWLLRHWPNCNGLTILDRIG